MGVAEPFAESFAGSAETIWQAVMALQQPALAGFSIEVLPEIDSTNTELMRRARAGHTEPTLLVAERQTAGRGRLGRAWLSDAPPSSAGPPQAASAPSGGSAAHEVASVGAQYPSLTFSLGLLLQPQAWDGLSLAVGTSVAGSLHPSIQLKWPNDLWVDGRKLAGILIETAQAAGHEGRYAVIGIGINIASRPSEGLSTVPAALRELLPLASAAQALQSLVAPLLRDVLLFEREGFAAFASRFAVRDALRGRTVALLDSAGMAVSDGVAQGVDGSGALLVHTAAGVQAVSSAEVSVRPAV